MKSLSEKLKKQDFHLFLAFFRNNPYLCSIKYKNEMSYTKDPIIISNPSEKLLEAIKSQKERKRSQLEKLRNMKPEDFSCRIILK